MSAMKARNDQVRITSKRRDLTMIMLVSSLAGAAISLSFPLLSLALRHEGASTAEIGWSAAGHGIGMLLSAPFYARVIARFGAIATMSGGLITIAAVLLILPLFIDPWFWFAARLVMGAAAAGVFIVTEAAVNAMVSDHNRGRILGIYASFFCIGYAAGPLIIAFAGATGWLPFVISAALFLTGLWPASQAHGAERALAGSNQAPALRGLSRVFKRAPLPIIAIFVFGFIEMGLMSLLPLLALERGIGEREAALLISVWIAGNILLQFPIGWLSDYWSKVGVMLVVTGISFLLMVPLYGLAPGSGWIWPVMLIMGGTLGALYTLSLSLLGTAFRGSELTVANTLFVMSLESGVMMGPALSGAAMVGLGNHHLISLWLVMLAGLAVFLVWQWPTTNRPVAQNRV